MYENIIPGLAEKSFVVWPDFIDEELTRTLRAQAESLAHAGALSRAGVGKGAQNTLAGDQRRDSTLWWEESGASAAQLEVYARWRAIQEVCNRALFLGLWELEAHWAVYPPGGFYRKHLDRFREDDRRTLSAVVYLNPPDWKPEDGGEIRLWPGTDTDRAPLTLAPRGGSLLLFLSDRVPHEVCITHRTRYSIAAWFKRR